MRAFTLSGVMALAALYSVCFSRRRVVSASALHRAGHGIRIEDHLAVDVAGGAADGLDQRGLAAQETFLIGVEDRDQRTFRNVEPFAQQIDPDQGVEGAAPLAPRVRKTLMTCSFFCNQLIIPNLGAMFPNMGTIARSVGLSDALFSKVQQRVLGLIFTHPERSFYTSEIVRNVHSGVGAVERELSKLERSGLVSVERIGNQKHYRANRAAPIFEELRGLVEKTVGLVEPIRQSFRPYARAIKSAFIYGSVAKGTDTADSDIDLIVIGDNLNYSDLYTAARTAESRLGRKVNPLFLSLKDWQRKASDHGSVISKISRSPKIFIVGSEEDLDSWANKNSTTL
jgi:predicted nucleotidyltransferase